MKSTSPVPRLILILLLSLLVLCANACSTTATGPADQDIQEEIDPEEETPKDTDSGFEEIPLPEDFPGDFPIPEGARIGYSGQDPAEGSFQIVVNFGSSLEEALAYFRQALPANGWTLESDESLDEGHGMSVSNGEYFGDLYFVLVEEEAYVDVSLDPQGSLPEISDVGEDLGASTSLGVTETDFPADFPLPTGIEQIPVPEKLASQGYQLAFSYPDMPEMALIQFSAALAGAGWMIGDFQLGAASYTMPFSNPATGFEGYALLTSDPDTAGASSITGCLIAFQAGK